MGDRRGGKKAAAEPPLPYVDDFEVDLDKVELEAPVQLEQGFSCAIVVDNVPKVPADKFEKLYTLLRRQFATYGTLTSDVGLHLPVDGAGATLGYAMVEYSRPEEALLAREQTNGHKLDRQHVFRVNMYDDLARYGKIPEVYEPPKPKELMERENLRDWLLDERAIDQYAIRWGDMTEVYWNDVSVPKPVPLYERKFWTETYVVWSPRGSYLATFHPQGVALWGGKSWSKLMRLPHQGVKLLDFSPNENYLVTLSAQYQDNDNPKDPQCIIVWDIKTGRQLRGFQADKERPAVWPAFQWSHDDRYVARLATDSLQIYETPSMDLLDKKSVKIAKVRDFCWSPTENLLAFWTPEIDNTPARVALMEVPSRQERRQANLFYVVDVKLHWQSRGDYLAAKVERAAKNKKPVAPLLQLFRIRDKDTPIEMLELPDQVVYAFAWEPKGNRFALVAGNEVTPKPDVLFYEMVRLKKGAAANSGVQLLKRYEKRAATHLFWSPQGTHLVIAGLRNMNGALEFYNVNDLESMATEEHFMCTDVEWDAAGRFVVTSVSYWRHQMENGYNVWSFNGKLTQRVLKDRFLQFLWRPRPPTLLSPEKEKQIRAQLHLYTAKYDKEDRDRDEAEANRRRRQLQEEREWFQNFVRTRRQEHKMQATQRRQLRRGADSDDESDWKLVEEVVDEVLEEREIILG